MRLTLSRQRLSDIHKCRINRRPSCSSGRPNVGKSTLFNRITGSRRAIVAPDRRHDARLARRGRSIWRGMPFQLFDTGGLFGASEDPLHELVVRQGQRAIAGADLLVFVVDGREGLVPGDERIARELRETGRPVLLAINKTDDKRARESAMEFFQLGLRSGLRNFRRARTRASRSCSTRSCKARLEGSTRAERAGADGSGPRPRRRLASEETARRHRRPAQRGQVVAGQPAAAARSGCSSATCRARRATRSTPC